MDIFIMLKQLEFCSITFATNDRVNTGYTSVDADLNSCNEQGPITVHTVHLCRLSKEGGSNPIFPIEDIMQ